MDDVLTLTDHAAQQNDRWLFIAALVVLGCVVVAVARYFVKQHEGLIADHKAARAESQKILVDLVEKGNKTNQELAVCLDRNTRAFEEVTAAVRFCRETQKGKSV